MPIILIFVILSLIIFITHNAGVNMASSSQILLYSGLGASTFCLNAIERQLNELTDNKLYRIRKINDLMDCWNEPSSIKAIVVPGGNAALMYYSMEQNAAMIKTHIEKYKVPYMGICAGAILATTACQELWKINDKTFSFHSDGDKYLDIFPDKVLAPIFPKPEKGIVRFEDFRPLKITVAEDGSSVRSAHIFSPAFLDCDQNPNMKILSTYNHSHSYEIIKSPLNGRNNMHMEPSVIKASRLCESVLYKNDKSPTVLLTGTHLEIDSKAVASNEFKDAFKDYSNHEELVKSFQESDAAREALLRRNFKLIGLSCKS